MMSVLVGSEGVVRAGRSDRSSDREGECRRFMPDVGDMGCGDVWIAAIVCGCGCDSLSTEIDASVFVCLMCRSWACISLAATGQDKCGYEML